ncbi:hypothetical protein Neosp_013165 [[Neocosmospora] mangrovei]
MIPFAPIAGLSNLVLLPEDAIDVGQEQQSHQDDIDLSAQSTLFPFPSFSLFSALSTISFTLPMDPAPSIGTSDSQAVAFHRTVLAPMKSTQVAAVSSHTLFLDFAIQNRMALHLLLAFSHSELAIHQGYSDRPPLESYLHFQHGSQLFTQQLEAFAHTNHIAMMLSFLYLYMFWMRRHPFDVQRLRELSASVLVYREINRYSQSTEAQTLGMELGIKRKLDHIREEQSFIFELAAKGAQRTSTTPLMALVAVTIFHALEIYLARSRDSALSELPVPSEVQRALKDLMTMAYYTVATGPVQLLERFQWALLIAGIETHDPIHRDWISASISDPAIKGILQLVQSAKGTSGITMRAVRRLVSGGYNDI